MKQWVDGKGYVNMSEFAKEHTALPWEIMTPADTTDGLARFVRTERKGAIVECRYDGYIDKEEAEANARFIVTACNHFEEMRETLKELHIGLKIRLAQEAASWGANADKTTEFLSKHPTLNKLEALLAKLEAE